MADKKDPAYLIRFPGKLRDKLHKEVEAKNTPSGPKWTLAAYILHLLETHPERVRKSK